MEYYSLGHILSKILEKYATLIQNNYCGDAIAVFEKISPKHLKETAWWNLQPFLMFILTKPLTLKILRNKLTEEGINLIPYAVGANRTIVTTALKNAKTEDQNVVILR